MGIAEIQAFKEVIKKRGKDTFNRALDITEKDIKDNRVAFNKRTSSKEFMTIFYRSLDLCLR